MSRIAKDPVNIPESVNLTTEGKTVNFKGPKGEMNLEIHESIDFSVEDNMFQVKWSQDEERAMAGTMRALVNNYVKGVSEGFEKKVKLNGVGYRAKVQGKKITFTLGFSHPVLKKELDFVSDLPEDFTECLNKWRNYSNNI